MFIKSLTIKTANKVIREIVFKTGMNLIIDNTPTDETQLTGNNVGKTTVLKLVDFCLGGKLSNIYADTENKNEVYDVVKDYLTDENNKISVALVLTNSLNNLDSDEIIIERNFLSKKKAVRKINGQAILDNDFVDELSKLLMPGKKAEKPTFRQIISHNIRYKDENINNTLKTLDKYASDAVYETLYLFLLGCTFDDGAKKQALLTRITDEESFKKRLESKQSKTTYEMTLAMLNDEIASLNEKKSRFNLNESFESDLEQLNSIKYEISKTSSTISKLNIRKSLIEEAKRELEQSISTIDLKQLEYLYSEAAVNVEGIQKTFEDLVSYHNNMLIEKARFITEGLPSLLDKIKTEEKKVKDLLTNEKEITNKIAKSDSFEELEKIIFELNEKYRIKGEYESVISQINEVDDNINQLRSEINIIDGFLFSGDFEGKLKNQMIKFNKYFSDISQKLYGEKYALSYDIINKNNQQLYKFNAFNANMSSGKKQGEILCFDLAYILFADEENLPCFHFLLNDKKELMHDNQLIQVSEFVNDKNVQLVVSILRDKLPENIIESAHIAVELSQEDKLFGIEQRNYHKT